jgi:hypothetical protein
MHRILWAHLWAHFWKKAAQGAPPVRFIERTYRPFEWPSLRLRLQVGRSGVSRQNTQKSTRVQF